MRCVREIEVGRRPSRERCLGPVGQAALARTKDRDARERYRHPGDSGDHPPTTTRLERALGPPLAKHIVQNSNMAGQAKCSENERGATEGAVLAVERANGDACLGFHRAQIRPESRDRGAVND